MKYEGEAYHQEELFRLAIAYAICFMDSHSAVSGELWQRWLASAPSSRRVVDSVSRRAPDLLISQDQSAKGHGNDVKPLV